MFFDSPFIITDMDGFRLSLRVLLTREEAERELSRLQQRHPYETLVIAKGGINNAD
jgi:hypothetical protein